MTRDDLNILSKALAFVAVLTNGQAIKPEDAPAKTLQLAEQIRDFCALHAISTAPATAMAEDADAVLLDQLIDRHIEELRVNGSTVLPESRTALLRLQDRLQVRNLRRMNRVIYTSITDERLADIVLSYLDEEIEALDASS